MARQKRLLFEALGAEYRVEAYRNGHHPLDPRWDDLGRADKLTIHVEEDDRLVLVSRSRFGNDLWSFERGPGKVAGYVKVRDDDGAPEGLTRLILVGAEAFDEREARAYLAANEARVPEGGIDLTGIPSAGNGLLQAVPLRAALTRPASARRFVPAGTRAVETGSE